MFSLVVRGFKVMFKKSSSPGPWIDSPMLSSVNFIVFHFLCYKNIPIYSPSFYMRMSGDAVLFYVTHRAIHDHVIS